MSCDCDQVHYIGVYAVAHSLSARVHVFSNALLSMFVCEISLFSLLNFEATRTLYNVQRSDSISHKVVSNGIFQYIRHPIALSNSGISYFKKLDDLFEDAVIVYLLAKFFLHINCNCTSTSKWLFSKL